MADQGYVEESGGQTSEKQTPEQEAERAIVTEICDNLEFVLSYEDTQRKAEIEELEFADDMWSADARKLRAEHTDEATNTKIPAKPTLSANLLDQNIQQVVAEARQARLALTVKPKNGLATTGTSEHLKGLVRSIQVESGALEVRLWALERTANVGRGGWLIKADYANDGDFDIDLREERILDYSTVFWDPYRQRADNSDAEWGMLTDWISEKERKRRWKDKPLIVDDGAWAADHNWFAVSQDRPDQRRCRIATYYKVVHTSYTLGFHPQAGSGWLTQGPEDSLIQPLPPELAAHVVKGAPGTQKREVDVRSVQIYVTDGSQILEQHPWHGSYIPIIECIGKESFVRGKRRFKGIICNAKDLSEAINVLLSSATEIAGTMPRTPYIMYEGQDEGFEEEWDMMPVKNFTRIHIKREEINGQPAPLPQRQQTELQVNGLLLLLRMMHEMFHAVTGSVSPQMRAVNPYDRSGKAIEALQRQGSAGTSNYLDNLATISMLYEGKVLLDAIPHYYDKPGRIVRVSGEDHEDETAIMLKVPFTHDADGNPVPVPCPTCQGRGFVQPKVSRLDPRTWYARPTECPACHGQKQATKANMPKEWQQKEVQYVDFSEGEFKAVAALDKSFQARQEEALSGMEAMAKAAPELVPVYADLWVRAMGFSGSNEIADRIKSRMPEGDEQLEDIPPHLIGRFTQLKQQHAQAMQALQEAQKMLDSDAMKTAGQKEIAMIKAALQGKVEQLKVQGRMLEVQATNKADERLEVLRGQVKGMLQESQQRHELLIEKMEEKQEIVLQLLKELGGRETERHSVALHDAAAREAEKRAGLSEAAAAVREDTAAERDHARQLEAGSADAARADVAANRQHSRDTAATDRQRAGDELSADQQYLREESSADSQATRDEAAARQEFGRSEASADTAAGRAETAAEKAHRRDLEAAEEGGEPE